MRPRSGGKGEEIARLGHAEEEAYNKTRKEDLDGVRLGVDHGHMRLESGANARLCTRMHASSQLIIHSSPSHAPRDAFCPPAGLLDDGDDQMTMGVATSFVRMSDLVAAFLPDSGQRLGRK